MLFRSTVSFPVTIGLRIAFNDDTERVIDNIGKAFSIVSTALGVLAVAEEIVTATGLGLLAVLWPLLAVTAALTVAFTLFGSKNAKIDKEIKESERTVKRLQNAYKELDREVSKAMGDSFIGAKKAEIYSKKLQLAEEKRQLQLEKSRSKKKQDESKIIELEGDIQDLQNDIDDLTNSLAHLVLFGIV